MKNMNEMMKEVERQRMEDDGYEDIRNILDEMIIYVKNEKKLEELRRELNEAIKEKLNSK